MLERYQWYVFGVFCLLITAILALRFAVILPLYMDDDLRTKGSAIIQATVAREGWLNSGLSLKHISNDSAKILYRSYKRGLDPIQCFSLSFTDGSLTSCNHKR